MCDYANALMAYQDAIRNLSVEQQCAVREGGDLNQSSVLTYARKCWDDLQACETEMSQMGVVLGRPGYSIHHPV